jgi:hypothetical protein
VFAKHAALFKELNVNANNGLGDVYEKIKVCAYQYSGSGLDPGQWIRQCCGSGSGIRDPVLFWPLDPGSRIGFFRIPDFGSRIPNPYIWELSDNFLGEKLYNSLKIDPNFFLQLFKTKIMFNFVKFVAK